MNLEDEIKQEFNLTPETVVPDNYIQENVDLMWIKEEINTLLYVPSYILWCINNKEKEGSLVVDYTLNALAEYGRSKNKENSHLNFKFLCNSTQIKAIFKFLKWCESNLELIDEKQLQRSLKHWA